MGKHHVLESFWLIMDSSMRYTRVSQPTSSTWCRKSPSEAERFRRLGNKALRMEQYEVAVKYYSESIAMAPNNSEELSLAFGCRSLIFLKTKKFELCLLDANRALQGPYPERSKQQLLALKEQCWKQLQTENSDKLKVQVRNVVIGYNSLE